MSDPAVTAFGSSVSRSRRSGGKRETARVGHFSGAGALHALPAGRNSPRLCWYASFRTKRRRPAEPGAITAGTGPSVKPDQPINEIRTMNSITLRTLATRRLSLLLMAAFAALALVLSSLGLLWRDRVFGQPANSRIRRTHRARGTSPGCADPGHERRIVAGPRRNLSGRGCRACGRESYGWRAVRSDLNRSAYVCQCCALAVRDGCCCVLYPGAPRDQIRSHGGAEDTSEEESEKTMSDGTICRTCATHLRQLRKSPGVRHGGHTYAGTGHWSDHRDVQLGGPHPVSQPALPA